jgi:hypothetical protein
LSHHSVNAQQAVNTVEVAPNFAASVATVDPTDLNFTLPGTGQFNLTAGQGAAITLPNGEVVQKAFRGLAESQAQRFQRRCAYWHPCRANRLPQIARRMVGSLELWSNLPRLHGSKQAGGELTKMADHQVLTVVRTSVQQVANAASTTGLPGQSRRHARNTATSPRSIAALQQFAAVLTGRNSEYGDGPQPPVHFNCRSTTIPIIDYEGLGLRFPKR